MNQSAHACLLSQCKGHSITILLTQLTLAMGAYHSLYKLMLQGKPPYAATVAMAHHWYASHPLSCDTVQCTAGNTHL